VSQFQTVSQQCSELYSSLFDADLSTLDYVSLYPGVEVGGESGSGIATSHA